MTALIRLLEVRHREFYDLVCCESDRGRDLTWLDVFAIYTRLVLFGNRDKVSHIHVKRNNVGNN